MKWIAVLVLALLVACGSPEEPTRIASQTAPTASTEVRTPEQMLASLDAGRALGSTDPAIAPFRTRLDSLGRKCTNPRSLLGDYAVVAQKDLRAAGQKVTLLQVLAGIDGSIPSGATGLNCAEVAAAFVTLTKR